MNSEARSEGVYPELPSTGITFMPAPAVKNIGCYDQDKLNKSSNTFSIVESTKQLFAEGKIPLKGAPNGCH